MSKSSASAIPTTGCDRVPCPFTRLVRRLTLALSISAALAGCATRVETVRLTAVVPKDHAHWKKDLTAPERAAMDKAAGDWDRVDSSTVVQRFATMTSANVPEDLRVTLATATADAARRADADKPGSGLDCWLRAAEIAFPSVTHPGKDPDTTARLQAIYNEACARSGAALHGAMAGGGAAVVPMGASGRSYQITLGKLAPGDGDPSDYDELLVAADLKISGLRERTVVSGTGGALVGRVAVTEERKKQEPFMLPIGTAATLSALLDFTADGKARLTYRDMNLVHQGTVAGRKVPLAGDFSATLATILNGVPKKNVAMAGLFHPAELENRAGLFMMEPYRPEKIPVVLVHGLMSKPDAFKNTYNELMKDPVIRERYQFWFFAYPTGWPIFQSVATFRSELKRARAFCKDSPNYNRMVFIGHSMGGIISNWQIRQFGEPFWKEVATSRLETLPLEARMKTSMQALVYTPPPAEIKRVIFVCTPHRGSELAHGFVGWVGRSVISAPADLVRLKNPVLLSGLTDLGKTLATRPLKSIAGLREDNPGLKLALERPLKPNVVYHSIIGDRNKGNSPDSSDGVVPYRSSHLEGAASELIVPSGHSGQDHPKSIAEIHRILLLHLRS
ncbi:hypothetical protein [Verrucomicrobium sp. BvORR106]|uniref:esterase/lipase family protein n=1 Tax=Verrucomicrobium sp. BvORR106 TaxID=1403819 RepID=UPI002241046F|nr:hypothetical protein [Verrucomicrobium sp. BvORR106]